MKLVYSRRALADLDRIAAYYAANASPAIAEAIEHRLSDVIDHISGRPKPLRAYRSVRESVLLPSSVIHSGFFTGYAMTQSISCIFDIRRDGL